MTEKKGYDPSAEDEEVEYITLEFDDDTSVECEVMGVFEADGKEYIALLSDEENSDVYIYGYKEVSDEEFELVDISDEEFEAASAEFDKLMSEEE